MTLTFWLRTTYRFRPSVSPVPRARDCGSPFRFRGALGTSRGRSRSRIDRARERRRTCWHDVPCVQYPVRGHYPLLNKRSKQKAKTYKRKRKLRNYAICGRAAGAARSAGRRPGILLSYMSRAVFENAETEWHGSRWTDCRHNRTSCEIQLEDSFDGLAAHGAAVAHVL